VEERKMATLGERDVAEVRAEGRDFRIFCEFTEIGFTATVYDIGLDQKIMDEIASSFEDGRRMCEEWLRQYLAGTVPTITWIHQPATAA
jgi:hypothetical protein